MNAREHFAMLKARDHILRALSNEMTHRETNPHWVDDERMSVVLAANEWAISRGLPTLTFADVERIETSAVGHIDYASKLALYVAEALYGVWPVSP